MNLAWVEGQYDSDGTTITCTRCGKKHEIVTGPTEIDEMLQRQKFDDDHADCKKGFHKGQDRRRG